MTETFHERDGYGLERIVVQDDTKRRYSYDAGTTWRTNARRARLASGVTVEATVVDVAPLGVTLERRWGASDSDGGRYIYIHEADSPGITRHAVGDVVELVGIYAADAYERPPTATRSGLRELVNAQ